jgi:mRNA interferase MazF
MAAKYIPARGDLIWLQFTPQAGHEQAGHRPAVALSPRSYNQKTGLALFCPVTSQIKGG